MLLQTVPMESTIKISFRNSYNSRVVEIYVNHDYYITYKPYLSEAFATISGQVVGVSNPDKTIKVKTSVADELITEIPVGNILSAVLIDTNNTQTNVDFVGIEISDVRLSMALHLKYLSGDYIQNVTPGELYEVTFVQSRNGKLELVTVIGKLITINLPYETFSYGSYISSQFSPITQARNQNPNCVFMFDCSNDYSSVRIKVDLRDIRGIKSFIIDGGELEPEKELPPIPEGYSYFSTTIDGKPSYVEVTDIKGDKAIVYGK